MGINRAPIDAVLAHLKNPETGLINYPVIIFFCFIILDYSWPFAVNAYLFGETSTSAWNPQIWPVKFAIPLAMGLMMLQAVAELLRVVFRDPSLEGPSA